jgi:HD-GYP domain-containing protein (c-di-GMP phosphodiesterase class II)
MLENTRMPATARQAVLNHHQRFDGSGWPDYADVTGGRRCGALAGDEIHVFSRIVAAANALDNLISDGDQRRPTVAALKEFAGPRFDGRFDPVVRDLMLRRIPPFPIGSTVRLSDGRAAVVTSLSFDQPCRPTVRLLSDESASRTNDGQPITIALVQESDVHIAEYHGQPVSDYLYEVAPSQRAQPVARACA